MMWLGALSLNYLNDTLHNTVYLNVHNLAAHTVESFDVRQCTRNFKDIYIYIYESIQQPTLGGNISMISTRDNTKILWQDIPRQ